MPLRRSLAAGLVLLALGSAAAAQDKAQAPIPAGTLALMAAKGTTAAAPVVFRAYKRDSELEVWKRGPKGYVFIKAFPICRWSGQLGPKRRNGDRQVPEGFYTVARRQMNPNSHYHLSFDVGYPNEYDRSHGSSGSAIMVHGICSSMGCFAMTNGTVEEIYAIAREALAGGQAAFQFQSYPFRMTAENLARHRADPNFAFWQNLKEGSDRFEATGEEPQVSVAAGRYAFAPSKDPKREAAYVTRHAIEEARIATLASEGIQAVRTTYSDGGQNAFWASYVSRGGTVGDISRPEALAFAAQEVVVVPARRRPSPVPEEVWAVWLASKAVPAPVQAAFVPAYARRRDSLALLSDPLQTRYADSLPQLLRDGIGRDPGARTPPGPLASAAPF
ncbi:murein L,D-transpeptidase family protein [Methylobacterium sp. J-076]|uniref:L,D-transpeptidase family protein n=1 Tax=Methylobacterium sp. J-076 TaxID=2836655 RepID=UPI001FBB2D9E|nr:murein L,D-transpeptidase family protein [Methylobacterium sp. J-076]MCJ2013171.1 murein L,D-transpeptidase [Methylobacterium sp. J-076]